MNEAREAYIQKHITWFCEEEFPDDTGIQWPILGFQHHDGLVFVEVEPQPNQVGYDKFKFVFSFNDPQKVCIVATYCWENEEFSLLSCMPEMSDKLPPVLNI